MSARCPAGSPTHARVARCSAAFAVVCIAAAVGSGCSSDAKGSEQRAGAGGSGGHSAGSSNSAGTGGGASVSKPTGGAGGSGGHAPPGSGSGGNGSDESCSQPGSTRICCSGGGNQLCGGDDEFPVWGPCQNAGGAPIDCSDPCGVGEFASTCDAGITDPPDAGPPDAGKTPPPPDAGCGPGMECKPGAIRYCDDPAGEWTMSTCDATGTWGACVETSVPDGAIGLGDCSPNDYSPEMCCPELFLCCQNDPGGAFEDWGSGACAAVSCP